MSLKSCTRRKGVIRDTVAGDDLVHPVQPDSKRWP
jgi:hypothetical protein